MAYTYQVYNQETGYFEGQKFNSWDEALAYGLSAHYGCMVGWAICIAPKA